MTGEAVDIRAARPDDPVAEVAELIWATDPPLMEHLFGNRETWRRALDLEWPLSGTLICHANTTLALKEGRVVGLIIGYPARNYAAAFDGSHRVQTSVLSAERTEAFERAFSDMERLFPEPDPGAFYIQELSVDPAARGAGLGRALLAHAVTRAGALGCDRLALDVAASNPAVGLYQVLGFTVEVVTSLPEAEDARGIGAHNHMVCPLDRFAGARS